jgi:hypothetical protein
VFNVICLNGSSCHSYITQNKSESQSSRLEKTLRNLTAFV